MADNNRNRSNQSNQDWDQNRNRDDKYFDANYYGSAGAYNTSYNSQYGKDYQQNQYGSQTNRRERNENTYFGDREHRDRSYGGNQTSLGSNYGSLYGSNYGASYGNSRASMNNERSRDWNNQDQSSTGGGHRGKGPKGYHRSEERIREDAYERLTYDDRVDASNIDVQVQGDNLILTGTVNSKEEKWRAEDIVENISGIHNVENRIRVGRADESSGRGSMSNATGTAMPTSTSSTSGSNMTSDTAGRAGISGATGSERTTGSETTGSRRGRNK